MGTGFWAPDNFHLIFVDSGKKAYSIGADGNGLREFPPIGGNPDNMLWSRDQKSIYANTAEGLQGMNMMGSIWKWNMDGSKLEKVVDSCCVLEDIDPKGQYLLGTVFVGDKSGIYEVSLAEKKCIPLVSGVVTVTAIFEQDGRSFLYAIASPHEVIIYRQPWSEGKLIGPRQVALKLPFTFAFGYSGNAYDFSRDLSTIVYARPGGHADLYLLTQK